jgi:hypothetical protein
MSYTPASPVEQMSSTFPCQELETVWYLPEHRVISTYIEFTLDSISRFTCSPVHFNSNS